MKMRGNHSHQQTYQRAAPSTTNLRSAVAAFVRAVFAGTMPHSRALTRPARARLARPGTHNTQTNTHAVKKSDHKSEIIFFKSTPAHLGTQLHACGARVCVQRACARAASAVILVATLDGVEHAFNAKASSRVRASKSPPIRVAQTTNVGRWMRPSLALVNALERARVVAVAVELMGTRRRTRHHSHHIQKPSSQSRKPYAAHFQLSAVAPRKQCQAIDTLRRARAL